MKLLCNQPSPSDADSVSNLPGKHHIIIIVQQQFQFLDCSSPRALEISNYYLIHELLKIECTVHLFCGGSRD